MTYDQHSDHQFWIYGRTPNPAVMRFQMSADITQVHEPVNQAEQVICGHVFVEIELIKQAALQYLPFVRLLNAAMQLPLSGPSSPIRYLEAI